MLALVLVGVCADAVAAVHVAEEEAVDHHVGIAADGAGEVGVEVEGEAVVPDVVGRVDGFGHGAEGEDLDKLLLAFAFDLRKDAVDGVAYGLVLLGGGLVAEAAYEGGELGVSLFGRLVVDAVDERFWGALMGYCSRRRMR